MVQLRRGERRHRRVDDEHTVAVIFGHRSPVYVVAFRVLLRVRFGVQRFIFSQILKRETDIKNQSSYLSNTISTDKIIAVVFIHAIPILVFMVLYSTALSTEFLAQPLYAFLFWLVGSLLLLLSAYLLPTSLLALVAVSVPGIYPIRALYAATDLVQGRRTKFIIRLLFGLLFLAVIWVIIMMPIIWLDLVIKQNVEILAGFPFVSLCLQIMTMFSFVYITAYIYLYYRRMLDGTE